MLPMQDLIDFLEKIYPLDLTEEFDNTGLLVGNRFRTVRKVMTCLTITPETIEEACQKKADLIVSHHPFPFHAGKRWTTDTPNGRILLSLVQGGISVFSPHTAHDSALFGINEQLAQRLDLVRITPLIQFNVQANMEMLSGVAPIRPDLKKRATAMLGSGRIGKLRKESSLQEFVQKIAILLDQPTLQFVGDPNRRIQTVAIGCGAADSFIEEAARQKADVLLLGEARFHSALEAESLNLALVLPGHYASERFAMDVMAKRISKKFPKLNVWASQSEKDPLQFATF